MTERDHDCLRNELIGQTIRKAAEASRFYRRRFDGFDLSSIKTVDHLSRLPVLEKDDVRAAGSSILCTGPTPSHVQNTSGSTGPPLLIYRSFEETQFIREFFYKLHCQGPPTDKPIVLSLVIPHHGTPTPVPGNAFVLSGAATDDELLEHTIILLSMEFALPGIEPRVSVIAGSYSQILTLTNYVMEKGLGAAGLGIQLIELTGAYLTPRWHRVLSKTWDCRVSDRYSLAEIFGGATLCPKCGCYHFDPHVVPELVNLSDRTPVDHGGGELLLTSLHPFVQLQPFIRYATGDIFARRKLGCSLPSWEYLGRIAHSLLDPRRPGRVLVAGRTLFDAVDLLPDVSRSNHFQDAITLGYHAAPGRPVFRGTARHNGARLDLRLTIQLAYTPGLFPEAFSAVRESIRTHIIENSPELAADIDRGSVEFSVETVFPGALTPVIKNTQVWGWS